MKIIKRLCSAVLSSAILLTSVDLSPFLAKSANVPQDIIADGNESVSENNEDYPFIDESEIENYENFEDYKLDFPEEQIIFDDADKSDSVDSDEQPVSKNEFKYEEEPIIIPEKEFAYEEEPIIVPKNEFEYEEESIIAPETEFVYEEEPIIVPENEFEYEEESVITQETEFAYEEESVITLDTEFEYEEEPVNHPEDSIIPAEPVEPGISDVPSFIEGLPIDLSEYNFDNVITGDTVISESVTISGQTVLYEGDLTVTSNIILRTCPHRLKSAKKSMQI